MTTDHWSGDSACRALRGWPGLGAVWLCCSEAATGGSLRGWPGPGAAWLRSTGGLGSPVSDITDQPVACWRLRSLDDAHIVAAAAAGGAGVPGGAGHPGGDGGRHALVEDARDDVLRAQLAPAHA